MIDWSTWYAFSLFQYPIPHGHTEKFESGRTSIVRSFFIIQWTYGSIPKTELLNIRALSVAMQWIFFYTISSIQNITI